MKLHIGSTGPLCLLLVTFSLSTVSAALAQHEAGQVQGPSKYLFLRDVVLKPEQNDAFAKLETEEVQALHTANAPGHYLGMWAITGPNHLLFTMGFDSFADLQKNHEATMAMSKLMDTLKTDNAAEASLVADRHSSIYKYDEELSLRAPVDLARMRFMRIILFHIRSGHRQDWEHLVKLLMKAYDAIPEAHWATFEKIYGVGSDDTYILVTPMAALSDVDSMIDNGKKFRESTGEDQLDALRKQLSADVESSESDLFALGPEISYVPESWLSASPDFWGKK